MPQLIRALALSAQHRPSARAPLAWRGSERWLNTNHVCCRLEIRWRARNVHPWDRQCTRDEREALFAEQALADTEAAVHRLFKRLPYIDVIDLSVLDPISDALIATGTVHRLELKNTQLLSVRMRLRELGIKYRFAARDRSVSNANDPAGDLCLR